MQINSSAEFRSYASYQKTRSCGESGENPEFYKEWLSRKREKCVNESSHAVTRVQKEKGKEDIDCLELIRQRKEEIFTRLQNGDTEVSIPIGAQSFTEEEWEEFLEQYDLMEGKDAKTTKCTYPSDDPQKEDSLYITWYTEDGIFCRKEGQTQGYEWVILLTGKAQYDKIMEFLEQFSEDDNLRFASHENFWRDFLNDQIDIKDFMEFFESTKDGVPDYSVIQGDSTYMDREQMKYAVYMNPHGFQRYSSEELPAQQKEIVERNARKLSKLYL